MCTSACHALMVPTLLRRPREGFQGPEYQLDAVELAEIWRSSIIPLSIPRGTEQPKHILHPKMFLSFQTSLFWSRKGPENLLRSHGGILPSSSQP